MTVSTFEQQRQANIQRNKELLKSLSLDSLSKDFHSDFDRDTKPKPAKRKKPSKPKEKVPAVPTRKSRRIAGITSESHEDHAAIEKREREEEKRRELERLKNTRLSGDLRLIDVIKGEDGEIDVDGLKSDDLILSRMKNFAKQFSMGDFYETYSVKQKLDNKNLNKLRDDLGKLEVFPDFDPLDIKLTPQRITSIFFHPSVEKRVVIAGDTTGHVGIWSVDEKKAPKHDDDEGEPDIVSFKIHGRNVSKINIKPQSPSKIYTSSYDGSLRSIDTESMKTEEVLNFDNSYGEAAGVSDFYPIDASVIYFTTLEGQFGVMDTREKKPHSLLRLHDKKIGSFAVNPQFTQQMVSASLDRSMRVWDLRQVKKASWSDFGGEKSPHCLGAYSSRLSVSSADWNSSGDIVCNGYDDTVNIFNLGDTSNVKKDFVFSGDGKEQVPMNLSADHTIKHNCQTGRWVSILKSRWQINPKDGIEKFVIANMNRYFDVYTSTGVQVGHLGDREVVGAVPAVCAFHPTENWIVGGSASGKGYLYI